MKKLSASETTNVNGGKTVTCYICGKRVWINPFYSLIRFWWSEATWQDDIASVHYYYGYNSKAHR